MCSNEHDIYKPGEDSNRSHGGEKKHEGSFHNWPIIQRRIMSVLEKIDLFGNWSVRQKMLAALTDELSGVETRENLEVMNEVRLVEVTAHCCDIRPVRGRTASCHISRALKTLHTSELLWCDA